jgi:hypothetical protein
VWLECLLCEMYSPTHIIAANTSIRLRVEADKSGSKPIRFFQRIDLPPGQLFLRVWVLDQISNRTGTLELTLKVGKK